MKFYGLTDKFLTQEEKDLVTTRYNEAKNDSTLSLKDRTSILVEAYFTALNRLNNVTYNYPDISDSCNMLRNSGL